LSGAPAKPAALMVAPIGAGGGGWRARVRISWGQFGFAALKLDSSSSARLRRPLLVRAPCAGRQWKPSARRRNNQLDSSTGQASSQWSGSLSGLLARESARAHCSSRLALSPASAGRANNPIQSNPIRSNPIAGARWLAGRQLAANSCINRAIGQ